ncbi:TIGR00269 family protein [Candidatus Micrarchaeota archaeon CG1_02_47_40]|nr:MAG: TIGR00269 family protein [Candidatus Micrarchaeota archaeon CG1_02_47_40]
MLPALREIERAKNGRKCHKCEKKPAVFLSHSQLYFCKNHFLEYFERTFMRTVRDFSLIKKGEHILIGLSGGKDSTALLYCLSSLKKSLPFKLTAFIIDVGVPGYCTNSLKCARASCQKLSIPLKIVSFKEETGKTLLEFIKGREEDSCSFCGVIRRHIMNRQAKLLKADKIAVAHNLDDFAQTTLMNIMRNEPARLARFGLMSGIVDDCGFVSRIKPFARLSEVETSIYAIFKNFSYNPESCPYSKNAFRQIVRKTLNEIEEKYPGTKKRIFAGCLVVQKALQEKYSKQGLKICKCKHCSEPSAHEKCKFCEMTESSPAFNL